MKRMLLAVWGASGALSMLPLPGHTDETVEEILISASPLDRSADELTQAALVLDDEELLKRSANSIGETLADQLGMSATYFGPVAGRPVIRGQEGSRVSVLDGGTSTLDVADLSPDHAVPIEPLFAERIEVIRGAGTLLYGSSGAGGVVNVIDGRIPEQPIEKPLTGAVEVRADSATEERAVAARIDGGAGGINWHLDAFDRQTEDIEISGFATDDPDERDEHEERGRVLNSEGEAQGYAGGVSWTGEYGFIGASVSRYETSYGIPGPEHELHEEEGEETGEAGRADDVELLAPGPFIDLEQTRIDVHGAYSPGGFIESLRFKFGHNDYEHVEVEPDGAVATLFENDAWEGRLEAVHGEVAGWRGAIGLQVTDRDFNAVGEEAFITPTESQSWGLFLLEEFEFERGRVEFGGRAERTQHDPLDDLPEFKETALSVAGGVIVDLSDTFHISGNLSRTERNPNIEELYANGPHLATGLFEVGLLAVDDAGLDKEIGINIDAGLHYHNDLLSWQVSVFYNDISDYIFRRETEIEVDGLPLTPYLQEDATFHGIEAEVSTRLGEHWDVRAFGDYVRGKTDDQDLPRIQPMRLGASLDYVRQTWSAGVEAVFHAEQDDIASFHTDSFTMLRAHVTLHVDTGGPLGFDVFLKGSNLLDEDARRSTSFRAAYVPLPGASVQMGVRARLR
jgi:iron complex outermembrane receptor protein